jgi:hypothetical protein
MVGLAWLSPTKGTPNEYSLQSSSNLISSVSLMKDQSNEVPCLRSHGYVLEGNKCPHSYSALLPENYRVHSTFSSVP